MHMFFYEQAVYERSSKTEKGLLEFEVIAMWWDSIPTVQRI